MLSDGCWLAYASEASERQEVPVRPFPESDGTIINSSDATVMRKLKQPAASIGLVADDPVASAKAAAAFLQQRGCSAEVVLDVEPDLPIAFVVTDVFPGTVLNFRKHLRHLPRPTSVPG